MPDLETEKRKSISDRREIMQIISNARNRFFREKDNDIERMKNSHRELYENFLTVCSRVSEIENRMEFFEKHQIVPRWHRISIQISGADTQISGVISQ